MTAAKLDHNWRAFLALRIARVVPLYFAISAYTLIEAVAAAHAHGKAQPFSWLQIFNSFAFIPIFNGATFTGPILVNGWTLSYEMWFYLAFAGLMKFSGGSRAGTRLPWLMAAAVTVSLVCFSSLGWGLPKFLFHPIVLEFCAGCLLYHYRDAIGKGVCYGMAGAGASLFYFAHQTQYLGMHSTILNNPMSGLSRAIIWGGFAVCIVGVTTQIDLKYQWQWPKFLLLLGDASYSLYLIPGAFLMTFDIFLHGLNKLAGHELWVVPPFWHGVVYVVGTIVCAIFCWKYFEVPTTRLFKRILFRWVPADPRPKTAVSVRAPADA
jgi:exopolysaccharide production protein ExoZ